MRAERERNATRHRDAIARNKARVDEERSALEVFVEREVKVQDHMFSAARLDILEARLPLGRLSNASARACRLVSARSSASARRMKSAWARACAPRRRPRRRTSDARPTPPLQRHRALVPCAVAASSCRLGWAIRLRSHSP